MALNQNIWSPISNGASFIRWEYSGSELGFAPLIRGFPAHHYPDVAFHLGTHSIDIDLADETLSISEIRQFNPAAFKKIFGGPDLNPRPASFLGKTYDGPLREAADL